jgi:4-aminobutyrate aminotransferase-like enzyme
MRLTADSCSDYLGIAGPWFFTRTRFEMVDKIGEPESDTARAELIRLEPRAQRTFTPSQAVIARSAGVFHWTPEGRRLFDFTSGVLVANLGHNPSGWLRRLQDYMGWRPNDEKSDHPYFAAAPLTAYSAVTPLELEASRRLVARLQRTPGGGRLEQVLWAASGSEAVQKALWVALARDRRRDIILATRFGFHGKKGLAGAVTGSETDSERDPRVRFVSFPMHERADVSMRGAPFDSTAYQREWNALEESLGERVGTLITEPYLGGGGSYHPPRHYLQLLQQFCRERDIVFVLDEVQSNFGRTGAMFAFERYGLEPDIVVLGKGLANGVPVAAAVGRADLFGCLDYGEGSDTWSGNPLSCAAVLATLDEFDSTDIIASCRESSRIIELSLIRLKRLPYVAYVRGEKDGMVWGVEMRDFAGRSAAEWANAAVLSAYRGDARGDGVHLLGPLAGKVIRIAPPLVITKTEATEAMDLLDRLFARLIEGASQS